MCNIRRFVWVAGVVLALGQTRGQSVADARAAVLGSNVTLSGTITSGPSLGTIRYLQDATAGIAAYPGSGSAPGFAPLPGDSISISGTLIEYNGLLEVNPVAAFTLHSTGNPLPEPLALTTAGLGESVEGRLVRLLGMTFLSGGNFSPGTWTVQDAAGQATVYIASGHPLVGSPVPTGPVDITGIASQYDDSPPYTSGHQLLPRGPEDITPSASIVLLPPVQQTDITPSGFTLQWQSNLPGSSQIFYGTTPALGAVAGTATATTAHAVTINGLPPATFHYAQAFSVANGDTAFSPVGLYATGANSSGTITAYFTKGADQSVSSGMDAIGLFGASDDTVKAYIDRVQSTLDIAMYNTNNSTVVQAVNDALGRGVQVRWITEGSCANWALNELDPAIPVLHRTNSEGSGMHNKFFVADAEAPLQATVMSGSCNWTDESFFDDHNNIVFIQDQALARAYRLEFEEMWGGSGPQPVPGNARFGADKTDNTPHLFNVGGALVETRFSPSDGVGQRIVQALDQAQASVRLAMYTFTDNTAGNALLAAHQRPGMLVSGDVEDIYATGSEFPYLTGQGVDLVSHLEEPGLLHHKYAVIDEGGSDPVTLTGSHNWTASAETVNDENTLLVHHAGFANLFLQEWTARHNAVTSIHPVGNRTIWAAWPCPAMDLLHVALPPAASPCNLNLVNALGRTVRTAVANGPVTLQLHALPAGPYLLTCPEQPGLPPLRVLVQH